MHTHTHAMFPQDVPDEALRLYHEFAAFYEVCTPERTRPAPKRRRGESSADWLGVSKLYDADARNSLNPLFAATPW